MRTSPENELDNWIIYMQRHFFPLLSGITRAGHSREACGKTNKYSTLGSQGRNDHPDGSAYAAGDLWSKLLNVRGNHIAQLVNSGHNCITFVEALAKAIKEDKEKQD